jgi:glutamine cyclotransferase
MRRAFLLAGLLAACSHSEATASGAGRVQNLRLKVVRSFPHDHSAFTQGLLWFDGRLYESTGIPGHSTVRRVELESGRVEARTPLAANLFGEGLARVGGRLIQLTWQNGKAIYWNLSTLNKEREVSYQGEGWGLCYDGKRLVMSDGSDRLTFRDPDSFARIGEVAVKREGAPVRSLNELECDGGVIYANVWQDDHIARIDARTGEVTAWIDASGLLGADERAGADVLNGIATLPGTRHLLVTGKYWPRLFEVELVPQ